MEEKVDPRTWDRRLKKAGLAPITKPEKVPTEVVPTPPPQDQEFADEMEYYLSLYESLPPQIKADIVNDLKKCAIREPDTRISLIA